MSQSFWKIWRLAEVGFLIAVAIVMTAQFCEAGETVQWRNNTSEALHVEVEGRGSSSKVEAGEEIGVGYIMETTEPFNVVIRDEDGCVVWKRDTTLDELRGEDLTVTITQDMLPPKDNRSDCDGAS